MAGKKYRTIGQDCRAVSEVYGQLLMMSIVVIAFSTIAMIVFSEGGAVKPEHTPHIDLQENFNRSTNTVQIVHSGGEAIDLSAIKIMFSVNGNKREFDSDDLSVKNLDGTDSSDDVFTLGDCIVIDATSMDLTAGEDIDMFFVYTPSQQVIQRTVLQGGSRELPYWISPHPYGMIYDESGNNKGVWLPTELIDGINDGLSTQCHMEEGLTSNETFTFGIEQYELNIKDPLKNVSLKVVYSSHDNSQKNMKLQINVGGSDWIDVTDLKGPNKKQEHIRKFFHIADKVNTVAKLDNLTVRFSAIGNTKSDNKDVWIDFVGVHIKS